MPPVLYAQLHAAPPSVQARRPELPPGVDAVMARASARSPTPAMPAARVRGRAGTGRRAGRRHGHPGTGSRRGRATEPPGPRAATVAGPPEAVVLPAAGEAAAGAGAATRIPPGYAAGRSSARRKRGGVGRRRGRGPSLHRVPWRASRPSSRAGRTVARRRARRRAPRANQGWRPRDAGAGCRRGDRLRCERGGDYDLYALREATQSLVSCGHATRRASARHIADGTTVAYVVGTAPPVTSGSWTSTAARPDA